MTTDGSAPAMDSMQLIASLFALLPIPVAVADEKGSIVLSNSSFAEVFHDHNAISGHVAARSAFSRPWHV